MVEMGPDGIEFRTVPTESGYVIGSTVEAQETGRAYSPTSCLPEGRTLP